MDRLSFHAATVLDPIPPFGFRPFAAPSLFADRYRLTSLLGRGGHGLVCAAVDTRSGAEVAVKLLARGDDDPGHLRRFLREAEILGQLHHPNTVRVLDKGQAADGTMFLVMERVRGVSLEAALRARSDADEVLSEADARAIATQVLDSLEEAHRLGLVHRDVKPSNVMLDAQDGRVRAKVLDFGIAQTQESSLTATGKVIGTPTYMSPEQCLGLELDGRTDLYALATVLYRCVSGRLPFDDPNALTVMYNHVNVPPRDLATVARTAVSSQFVDVVMRGLAKTPEQRFADAATMRAALQRTDQTLASTACGSQSTQTASPLKLPEAVAPVVTPHRARRLRLAAGLPWLIAVSAVLALGAGRAWPRAEPTLQPLARAFAAPVRLARIAQPVAEVRAIAAPAAVVTPPAEPAPEQAAVAPVAELARHHARTHPRKASVKRPEDPRTILPPE